MDIQTLRFYAINAQEVAARYELVDSPLAEQFRVSFSPGGKILDVGCGSGRDLAELQRQGFDVYGLDGTAELVDLAQQLHPELAGRVVQGLLPSVPVPFGGDFDGVLCCAVLMHLGTTELPGAVHTLKQCLKPAGKILVSLPLQKTGAQESERDASGRIFHFYSPACLRKEFEKEGFSLLQAWENVDALNRQGVQWYTHLYQLK